MNTVLDVVWQHVRTVAREIALGYAWICLLTSWRAGAALALLTMLEPSLGSVGLLGAVCAWYAAHMAGADSTERPISVFNGLLCGLFVGHTWVGGMSVVALSAMVSVFAAWLTVVLGRLSWSLVRLPILSLPFSFVAMLTLAAGGSLSTLHAAPYTAPAQLFGNGLDAMLSAFGALYFMPNPTVGALIVLLMLASSRYYGVLALLGYAVAASCLQLLGAAPEHLASVAWDCNAILAAVLVGGLFATPSLLTAVHALLAALLAAWLSLSLGRILSMVHLVPFSMPFVMAAWLVLYAGVRSTRMAGCFNIDNPDLPERTHERTQMALVRVGSPDSVPLALPCMGVWTVSQGFGGQHTHRGPWRHALDFIVVKEGTSFTQQGRRMEDFYCYNLPVLSPAYGQVWRVVNDVPDNSPGNVNLQANWGNHVTIRLANGKFVLLAHLKPASIAVVPGAWLKPGDFIGLCGNSGRSPQPHLHLHVQISEEPGSPTAPFHLCSVMVTEPSQLTQHRLATVPTIGSALCTALEGDVRPLYLLPGRGLAYAVSHNGGHPGSWRVWCEIDAQSRMNLVSSRGARCVVESTWAVFACYARNAVKDPWFDQWLLACGYTPVSMQATAWSDVSLPARFLPMASARWCAALLWPWAAFASSTCERVWDAEQQAWKQQTRHRQQLTGIACTTVALLTPQLGCSHIHAEVGEDRYVLQATHSFQRSDLGVPAWEIPVRLASLPG